MLFGPFYKGAKDIYERKFTAVQSQVKRHGLVVDPVLVARKGGLGVVFRYDDKFVDKVTQFGQQLAACTEAVPLGADVHTTICFEGVDNFVYNPGHHEKRLRAIAQTVNDILPTLRFSPDHCRNAFGPLLYNQDSVVAPGLPSLPYFELLNVLNLAVQDLLPAAGKPWATHATVVRHAKAKPAFELKDFFNLMASPPAWGMVSPNRVDVTYSQITEDYQIVFKTIASFPLPKK